MTSSVRKTRTFTASRITAGQNVEYPDHTIHTNTIEGAFAIFKRGMKGVYPHCAKKHPQRYVAEFEFRYTHRERTGFNVQARVGEALKSIVDKRLTYEGLQT